jgi:hypothetical protein
MFLFFKKLIFIYFKVGSKLIHPPGYGEMYINFMIAPLPLSKLVQALRAGDGVHSSNFSFSGLSFLVYKMERDVK